MSNHDSPSACGPINAPSTETRGLTIRRAVTAADRDACVRIRGREFGTPEALAANPELRLEDDLDSEAILLIAERKGVAIGTVRVNVRGLQHHPDPELFGLRELEAHYPDRIAFHSKLAVLPEFRSGRTMLQLTQASFSAALEAGSTISLIGCRTELLPMYAKLGFRSYRPARPIADLGLIHPLWLDNHDEAAMEAVRSPWLPVLRDYLRGGHDRGMGPIDRAA